MCNPGLHRAAWFLGLCVALCACGAPPRDRHVQPQRPTFASNTSTTPEDVLELELGAAFKPRRPRRDSEVPLTLKLGLGPRTELFGDLSVWRSLGNEEGLGDTVLGVRHRVWEEAPERPSTAFQLSTKLPSANEGRGLGSGEIDFFAAGIHTRTVDEHALTLFYQLGLIGEVDRNAQDVELAVAGKVETDLSERLAGFGELAGIFQPENSFESVFVTVGGAYRYAPWLYFDLGLAVGLTNDAPDFLVLIGLTRSFGRILGRTAAVAPGP